MPDDGEQLVHLSNPAPEHERQSAWHGKHAPPEANVDDGHVETHVPFEALNPDCEHVKQNVLLPAHDPQLASQAKRPKHIYKLIGRQ